MCDAVGGGGLRTPLPFPLVRGKGLLGLRSQFQSLRPTLLGPDGNLSVGTELSGEAGLPRREKGCYQHGSTVLQSSLIWWWPQEAQGGAGKPSSKPCIREPSETPDAGWVLTFINSFLMNLPDF